MGIVVPAYLKCEILIAKSAAAIITTGMVVMPVDISVRRLQKYCNPYEGHPWGTSVSRKDVERALRERRLIAQPGTDDHAGRIAYLVENEAPDHIEVDVGVPALGCYVKWLVQDGNHRLAAAIYGNRKTIRASVGGQLDYAKKLFGVDCEEPAFN